ncbi:MAG: hypothetical protein WC661_09300 [Opitutaceae bacterium]
MSNIPAATLSPKTSVTSLLAASLAIIGTWIPTSLRAGDLVWIEAEQARSTNIQNAGPAAPKSPEQTAALSGGNWLTGKVAPDLFAEYDVTVPESGRHSLYARRFWLHGAFRWRFDNGPWLNQDQPIQTALDNVACPGGPLTWVDLGYADLAAGPHVLRIELLADSAYKFNKVFAFDCFALSNQNFQPKGLERTIATPVAALEDPKELGRRLPRTMSLLGSATPAHRTPINILLYGQSIIASSFVTSDLRQYLQKTYPDARVTITNTAIGGYTAEHLHRTAWQDLYPAYPDLVVFHDYGGEKTGELEEMFRNIRRYTTADILTWTHHVDNFGSGVDRDREASADFNRALAKKYGYEIAEVREQWKEHLKLTRTDRTDYLVDKLIHLNPKGARLLVGYLTPHFKANPLASDDWKQRVRTLDLGQPQPDITYAPGSWKITPAGLVSNGDQPLRIAFTGNRVELVGAPVTGPAGDVRVLIDGKPASGHPGAYAAERSTLAPGAWWPAVSRVVLGPDPITDTCTLSFTNVSPDGAKYDFTMKSLHSGDEGRGTAGQDFVSRSNRIRIAADDLDIAGVKRVTKKDLPPSFETSFNVRLLGLDQWRQPANARPEIIIRDTVFQELETRPHVLELVPDGKAPVTLRSIILHNPLAKETSAH